jgi:hypothetical protein
VFRSTRQKFARRGRTLFASLQSSRSLPKLWSRNIHATPARPRMRPDNVRCALHFSRIGGLDLIGLEVQDNQSQDEGDHRHEEKYTKVEQAGRSHETRNPRAWPPAGIEVRRTFSCRIYSLEGPLNSTRTRSQMRRRISSITDSAVRAPREATSSTIQAAR